MKLNHYFLKCAFGTSFKTKPNILICPDKFKYTMSASEVAFSIQKALPEYSTNIMQLADGGEGSLEVITKSISGEWIEKEVCDPLFRKIKAKYLVVKDEAYIEMCKASGLGLLSHEERNPMKTTTFGTGELIKSSLQMGCKKIHIFVGGSATNDGGIGMASALSYQFRDQNQKELTPVAENLMKIKTIGIPHNNLLQQASFNVYTDVQNTFTGKLGASHVFASQKGATPSMILELDLGLQHLNSLLIKNFGKNVNHMKGSGAAGGLAGGSVAFLNAKLQSGIKHIFKIIKFEESLKKSDFIITGEGKFDSQTLEGKVVSGVISLSKKYNKSLIIVCGQAEVQKEYFQSVGMQNVDIIALNNEFSTDQNEINKSKLLIEEKIKEHFSKLKVYHKQ